VGCGGLADWVLAQLTDRDQRHLAHRSPAAETLRPRRCGGRDVGRDREEAVGV